MSDILAEITSYQEERDKVDKRLKFWESKSSIKSQSALKRVEELKERRRSLGYYIDSLVKKRDELTVEQNNYINGIIFEDGLINRYQKLKEEVILRKKQKFDNSVFGMLKTQAYQLEQLFYTLTSQRNKIINDNRKDLEEFNLSKIELQPFNYVTPTNDTQISESHNNEEVINIDDSSEVKSEEVVNVDNNEIKGKEVINRSEKRMTRMERLHPEKFKELQELKKNAISESQPVMVENNSTELLPETKEFSKQVTGAVHQNNTIPYYFNNQYKNPRPESEKTYDVNQKIYPTPAVLTPEEICKGRSK